MRPNTEWYTDELRLAKRDRRKAERRMRKSNLTVHRQIFQDTCLKASKLLLKSKKDYFSTKISEIEHDQKQLHRLTNDLMGNRREIILPSHKDEKVLADKFCEFFVGKISAIRDNLTAKNDAAHYNRDPMRADIKFEGKPLRSLSPISPQVSSRENEGSLGNIEFSCPTGQYFNGGYCFSVVDVPMIWSDADRTQGQHLFWVLDVDELKAVDHLAKSTWEYYWSGLSRWESWLTANEALWSNNNKTLQLEEFVWEDNQPDTGYGGCVHIKKDGYGTFDNCLRKLPFLCKAEAVLKGYFRCRSGEGIKSKFVCDGHNDCQDMSDEANCVSRCHHVINAEYGPEDAKPSGVIVSSGNYQNSKSCVWSIVTNVGSIIKVQIKSFSIEKNADVMELRTGGIEGEIFLAELTGTVDTQPVYYSSDNVFNIRLVTDSTVIHSGGFRIPWTTDVAEVFNDVQMLTATSSVQHLKSPLYDTGYLLKEKVFEWKITASTKNIITLEFENLDIGTDAKLYLWDQDEISLTPTLDGERPNFPKGIYIKYWEGCSIHEMATEGTIQSPGYIVGGYPENIECTWTIQRPTSRTLALRFNKFDIQSQGDYLKVYNDTSEALHTGDGFTGTTDLTNNFEVRSTNGYIKLVFTTNYVLTDKGFEAEFSLDCQKFAVSPETHFISKSKYKTTFGNIVDFSCDEGYSFVNEGHSNNISIRCQKGGEWNKPRIPNCIAVDNGYIVESSGVKVGNNVTYKCNDGFTMNGEPVIKCLQDGNWEDEPKCTASRCVSLSKPIHGAIKILTGDGRGFASVVQYVCDPGYETYGHVTTYCQTGGKWSHVPPSCERIWCPIPRTPNGNWYPRNAQKFEGTITLTCDRGFHINGTNTRVMVLKCESGGHFLPDVTCFSNTGYHLTCPLNKTIYIHSAAGEIFNVSDVVSVTPSDSDLTFTYSPEELLTFDYTSMVEQKKVVVTATYKSETEYQCSFFVETKADACFKESFPVSVPNAAPVTCTSGNISCTVTCNSGYVFFDGNTTKTYDCTGQNMWMPALPPDTCIKYDEPSYIIELQVVYKSNPDLEQFLRLKLLNTDVNQIGQKTTCKLLLVNQLDKVDFLEYTGSVQCDMGTTTIVRQTSDSSNQEISGGNQCENGIKKTIGINIPCPPGTYFGNDDECNVCPDGKFQNNFGQDECLECPSDNPVPSEDKTTCLGIDTIKPSSTILTVDNRVHFSSAVCPAGFISVDGLPTCMPCPEDRFWVNKTYCQPCPGCGNTAGKNAISDINGCKDTTVHQLICPLNKTIYIHTAAGTVFNVRDVVSVIPSDSKLKFNFSPAELITLDHTAMVEQKKVVVTTSANACFRESFPVSIPNAAAVTCTSGNISCTVTCNSGFVFFDGNTTKTYDCTGQNIWLPALPPDICIKYGDPSDIIVLQVVYKTDPQFAKDCKGGHDEKIKTNNASFTNAIYNLCNNALVSAGPLVITHTETTTTGFDFRTIFEIKLTSNDLDEIRQKNTCELLLKNQLDRDEFLQYTSIVNCNTGTTNVVRHSQDSFNMLISQCENGIKRMTTIDSSLKCIPCPPGTYSGSGDDCNVCPDGKFQSNYGQDECLDCPSDNLVPSENKTTCLAVCPAGFISVDGLPTCMPCPEDHYWVNKTLCELCPNSGSTAGINAITDINGCKVINCDNIDDCVGKCTGPYVDPKTNRCDDLLNDYQCICKAGYTSKNCTEEIDECLRLYPCEHGGTCTDKVADFECSCREGWTGKRCETPIEYCAPSPCLNGGVCFNLTDNFFCRCPGGTTGVTCGNSPDVCSIINPCTIKGTCEDKEGSAQCNCNDGKCCVVYK
ncbi:unnamed protein product [Mytilus edulis]|uniref:Uncharacterized protein n=1 Tax=Mytilus edulis TaxID=6550 RepID=A0A8S3UJW6_MYTED|nr:unnamed protein product [Mytilus edulis]